MFSKVIIVCPWNITGGPDALHQLCGSINRQGGHAYIYYTEKPAKSNEYALLPYLQQYFIHTIDHIEDASDTAVVLPEIYVNAVGSFTKATVFLWWLGLSESSMLVYDKFRSKLESTRLFNACANSRVYVELTQRKYKNTLRLIEPIAPIMRQTTKEERQNYVVYNPVKGSDRYVEKISVHLDDSEVKLIPARSMSSSQLAKTFSTSKVYLDFGTFPGRERMPREAATAGCCLITGQFGCSSYWEDLPIPEDYKFSLDCETEDLFKDIALKVKHVIQNYERCIQDFRYIRSIIKDEPVVFDLRVKTLFCL